MLTKLIRINTDDLLLCAGVNLGVFLLLLVANSIAMAALFPCDAIMVSGILMLAISAVMLLYTAMGHVNLTYVQALKFGQTRRRALGLTLGLIGFEALFTLAVVSLLAWVEQTLCPYLWMAIAGADGFSIAENGWGVIHGGSTDGVVLWIDTIFYLDWQWYPVWLILACLIGVIAGALIQRFGRKGNWILWAAWMFLCLGGPRLLPWKQHTIVDWLFPLLGITAVIALVWSIWSLLHAAVKG